MFMLTININIYVCIHINKQTNINLNKTKIAYAGHYTPQLAQYILDHGSANKWKVKGLLLGNPAVNSDWYYNTNEFGMLRFMFILISSFNHKQIQTQIQPNSISNIFMVAWFITSNSIYCIT